MTTGYLSLARAEFDYSATTEEELSITEDTLLWVLENDDPDWHKVKIKSTTPSDNDTGLVPASYLAPLPPLRQVHALYDYSPALNDQGQVENEEELEIVEGEALELMEDEGEWVLVQRAAGGGVGFVPASYVEDGDALPAAAEEQEDESYEQPTPAPVVAAYSDPLPPPVRTVAPTSTPAPAASAGNVKTWAVTEVDKKKKKKKGTLGVGNGAVFFASETDKTPVQQWPLSTLTNLTHEKSKHLHLTFPSAGELHFVISSKAEFEDILAKLEGDREVASPPPPSSAPAPTPAPAPAAAQESTSYIPPPPPIRGAAATSSIPPPPIRTASSSASRPSATAAGAAETNAIALYDFDSAGADELSLVEGERVWLVLGGSDDPEWAKIRKGEEEGVVPASYVELDAPSEGEGDDEEQRRADEQALAAQLRADKLVADREAKDLARRKAARAEEARVNRLSLAPRVGPIPVPERGEVERLQREEEERMVGRRERARVEKEKEKEGGRERGERREGKEKEKRAVRKPDTSRVRTWKDRTGQFKVDAEFLGLKDNKIRLHKLNGVIIEVPVEKMSNDDTAYLKRELGGDHASNGRPRSRSTRPEVEVEPPTPQRPTSSKPTKSRSNTDWFDFFLNAGCDMDNCTRYARNAESEGFDEALIPDLEESNLRSIGLKEGDIIRVKKFIREKYHGGGAGVPRPPPTPEKTDREAQIAADAILAKALSNGTPTPPAPNLFATGPNGELKPRRGRRNTTTSNSNGRQGSGLVDGATLASAGSELAKVRGTTPTRIASPPQQQRQQSTGGSSLDPSRRSSSTIPQLGGFDDDAWDIKPTSTKPAPAPTPVAAPAAPTPPPVATAPLQPPAPEQPARAGSAGPPTSTLTYNDGLLAQLGVNNQQQRPPSAPVTSQATGASYNGPRLPVAPIAANQGLLAPLVPTRTGFSPSPFGGQGIMPMQTGFAMPPMPMQQQSFTGMPMMSQPTGFGGLSAPMGMQPTGSPNFLQSQATGYQPQPQQQQQQPSFLPSQPTGFLPPQATGLSFHQPPQQGYAQTPQRYSPAPPQQQQRPIQFNPLPPPVSSSSPAPAPSTGGSSTAAQFQPGNIFSEMKSGTFAKGSTLLGPQAASQYDALRPQQTGMPFQGLQPQATGFPQQMQMQPQMTGFPQQQMQPQMTGFPGQQQQQQQQPMFQQATGMPQQQQQFGQQNGFMRQF